MLSGWDKEFVFWESVGSLFSMSRLSRYRSVFLGAALLGFVGINLPFLYFAFIETAVYQEAMQNGMASSGARRVGEECRSRGSPHD